MLIALLREVKQTLTAKEYKRRLGELGYKYSYGQLKWNEYCDEVKKLYQSYDLKMEGE